MHASAYSDQRMKRWIANGIPTTVIVSATAMPSSVTIPRQGPDPAEHSPIGLPGEDVAPGVDLAQDDGDRGGRDDRREQAADAAEQHGEERRHRPVPAVERHQWRDAGEMEDHPLDGSGEEVDRNEDRARRGEGQEVLRVHARRRAEDLTGLPPASELMRIRRAPCRRRRGADQSSEAEGEKRDERQRVDQRPVQDRRAARHGAAEEVAHAQTERVPLGTSMLVLRSPPPTRSVLTIVVWRRVPWGRC